MGSMSKDEVNVFLFDEVKFLKATLVQMREAIEKLLPKVSCDSIACQSRCLCGAEKISEYGRKLLSQTQDATAWHQASLLRAEAKGKEDSARRLRGRDSTELEAYSDIFDSQAAALRKKADGLEK